MSRDKDSSAATLLENLAHLSLVVARDSVRLSAVERQLAQEPDESEASE